MNSYIQKFSTGIALVMLVIILMNIIGSIRLYQQIDLLEVTTDRGEMLHHVYQYEYELLNTRAAFFEAFPTQTFPNSKASFQRWLDILYSRAHGMTQGVLAKDIRAGGFNASGIIEALDQIESLTLVERQMNLSELDKAKEIFNQLTSSAHKHQLANWTTTRKQAFIRKIKTYEAFRNSLVLSTLTLLIAAFISYYLYRNNQRLVGLQHNLEDRVSTRTEQLERTNRHLRKEIAERARIEEELKHSQKVAEQALEHIEYQANYDDLTQLANRRLFAERFDSALEQARQDSAKVAILFIDLDRFKHINDTLGHSMGDRLLQQAGQRLKQELSVEDTAARLGGDEFAVILSNINNLQKIEGVVGRILHSLSQPYKIDGNDAFISASIGITLYPDDGDNSETLLRKADSAMYQAKGAGRNNYRMFTQQMDIDAQQRRQLDVALHQAVEQQQFELYFQPIYDLSSGQVVTAEALIRWHHPERGLVLPGEFISLAEDIGLIIPIGEWVLLEACRQAKLWPASHGCAPKVSVNVSSPQFQRGDMAQQIERVLRQTGLAAERLIIEITESLLMEDAADAQLQLESIRKLGVQLAIDDFGTGYSSLSYLNKFPISTIKIDRSFISQLDRDTDSEALLRGILSIVSGLKLQAIAEGVETQEHADFLQSHGCSLMQGYLYSKPVPVQQLTSLLTNKLSSAS